MTDAQAGLRLGPSSVPGDLFIGRWRLTKYAS
jgi:hypothetical protein